MKIVPDYANGWKLVPDEGEAALDTTTDTKTVLSKYHPPIEVYMGDMDAVSFTKKVNEEIDNEICYEIRQKFCVDGSKEELMKALNYDRHQYEAGYRDGLNDGLEKSEEKWIPVTERMPEETGFYLCTLPMHLEEPQVDICIFNKASGTFLIEDGTEYYVSAWMLLPKPYEKGETNESE